MFFKLLSVFLLTWLTVSSQETYSFETYSEKDLIKICLYKYV